MNCLRTTHANFLSVSARPVRASLSALVSQSKPVELGSGVGRFSSDLGAQKIWEDSPEEGAHTQCLFLDRHVTTVSLCAFTNTFLALKQMYHHGSVVHLLSLPPQMVI